MSSYYPQILTGVNQKKRNETLKGFAIFALLLFVVVGLYALSNHSKTVYHNSLLACSMSDIDNCDLLKLPSVFGART